MSSNDSTNSEIERLSGEVKSQRKRAEFWDTWNIRFLFIAGVAAIFLAVTAVGVSRSNKTLTNLSDQLDKEKDRALQGDLKSKDDEIAGLHRDTAVASENAASAHRDAEKFKLDIAQANERAATAERDTAQAKLEIAKIKLPRRLTAEQQQKVAAAVARFAGQKFAFLVFGDPESLDLLGDISTSLKLAEWIRVNTPSGFGGDTGYSFDGSVVPSINSIGLKIWAASDNASAQLAILALSKAISSEGVSCEAGLSEQLKKYEIGLIVISVGKKLL